MYSIPLLTSGKHLSTIQKAARLAQMAAQRLSSVAEQVKGVANGVPLM